MSDFSDLVKRAMEIRAKYDDLNKRKGQTIWTGLEQVAGLNGDVGDLTKLVMAKENKRRVPNGVMDLDAAIEHELGDILWQIIDIAKNYNIDLEQSFLATMDELDERLAA